MVHALGLKPPPDKPEFDFEEVKAKYKMEKDLY